MRNVHWSYLNIPGYLCIPSNLKGSYMWSVNTIWFDMFIFSTVLLLGNILMGHFEERTSRYRKLIKSTSFLVLFLLISVFLGKLISFTVLGVLFIPVLYIHIVVLGKHGINGWTGEPKDKYYEFRGWDKDIFKNKMK